MKKTVLSITLIIALLISMALPVVAENVAPTVLKPDNDTTVVLYEDGSKLTISLAPAEQTYSTLSSTSSIIPWKKEAKFENSNGEVEWIYTLHATFSYVKGVSSVCTDAYYTQTIYQGNWTFSNGAATKSGNTARGTGNYIKKVLFITTKDIDLDITITCDIYGNIN